MKRIAIIAALTAAAVSAGAQNMYDAAFFSQNNYYGTARSMALGNAMTAVGGDLGSIGLNPAGSAVATYSQISITPGVTISTVGSLYSPTGRENTGILNNTSFTRMTVPNLGVSFNFETGNPSGVRSWSFAFLSSQTNNFNSKMSSYGRNASTSKFAELAYAAGGIDENLLADYDAFNNTDIYWDILSAYQGGAYSSFGFGPEYAAVTQALATDAEYMYVPGALSQASDRYKFGSKNDIILNFGLNINEKLFLGMNLGFPAASYEYGESFIEAPIEPDLFSIRFEDGPKTYFTDLSRASYNYQYVSRISGAYAKIGAIFHATPSLRIGAAFQTPSALTVSENWQYRVGTFFTNSDFNTEQSSPTGEYSYSLRSPYVASLGLAYTFAGKGFISMDYEFTDYSVMKFSEFGSDRFYDDPFADLNEANRLFAGVSHSVRIGAEYKVTPAFSLRAGFNALTTPQRRWMNSDGVEIDADDFLSDYDLYRNRIKNLVSVRNYEDAILTFSLGAGYSSPGAFFADFAVRRAGYPQSTFRPYYDYTAYDKTGTMIDGTAPAVFDNRSVFDVVLTLGLRF